MSVQLLCFMLQAYHATTMSTYCYSTFCTNIHIIPIYKIQLIITQVELYQQTQLDSSTDIILLLFGTLYWYKPSGMQLFSKPHPQSLSWQTREIKLQTSWSEWAWRACHLYWFIAIAYSWFWDKSIATTLEATGFAAALASLQEMFCFRSMVYLGDSKIFTSPS